MVLKVIAQAAPAEAAKPAPTPAAPTPDVIRAAAADPVGAIGRWSQQVVVWLETKGPRVLVALVLLVAAWLIAGWVRRIVLKAVTRAHVDITLGKFVGNLARWAIILFAVISSLGTFGVDTTAFAALIAGAGLAIGLALQGNLGNLACGVLLLVFRPFKIGDSVIVAGQAGVVDGIDLFTTNLDTTDNRRIIVPNGAIFSGVIENQTRHPRRLVSVNVPVSGAAALDAGERALMEAAHAVVRAGGGALADPAPVVTLADLAPTTTFSVGVWAETPKFPAVRQALLREIKSAVDAHALAPPPAAMIVHVRQAGP